MKKLLTTLALTLATVVCAVSCTAPTTSGDGISGSITASGSSALKPLADIAVTEFVKSNPNAQITVNAGGSGNGLKAIAEGSVDIGNSDLYAQEKLTAEQVATLKDNKVCVVGFAAVVNVATEVENLTNAQLIDIYTGEVTNWSEVGGADLAITLCTRPEGSGTRATFKQFALQGNEEIVGFENDNSGEIATKVETTPGAIGYLALSYELDDTARQIKINGVEASYENIYAGTYEVWSYEHMYTGLTPNELTTAFIEYMMSSEFAPFIEANGYGAGSKLTDDAKETHPAPEQV